MSAQTNRGMIIKSKTRSNDKTNCVELNTAIAYCSIKLYRMIIDEWIIINQVFSM